MAFWDALDDVTADDTAQVCADHLHPNLTWNGPVPIRRGTSPADLAAQFWQPLKRAIPDLKRQTHMVLGGASSGKVDATDDGRMWVGGTGYLTGTPTSAFLDIPATGQPVRIRWGEFLRFENNQIVEIHILIDFIDWFDQIGLPVLPRPKGAQHVYPAPTGLNGQLLAPQDHSVTAATLTLGRALLYGGLNSFDSEDLTSMGMADFFHENLKWYGPGGIGACLSLEEFQTLHQQPWLIAYPDRKVQDLDTLFAEGPLLAASGVIGVIGTHLGPYLGHPATGKQIKFNGIDFWLRDGDMFTENWVFVDMIDIFDQFGTDLFAKMREQTKGLPQ